MLGALAAMFLLPTHPVGCRPDDRPVRVTVVVVLASTDHAKVDPRLAELAREVRKRDPKLTGFTWHATENASIPVGDSGDIRLIDKEVLKVKVEKSKDADGRVSLTVKAPGVPEVTYACVCDKFFPVATPYQTKTGEQLIIAVMGKPCTAKK
jgi:hypothetical protein